MDNINEFINFCDEMEIVTEGKYDNVSTLSKQFYRCMGHMTKLRFKTKDCSNKWIISIIDSCYIMNRDNKKKTIDKYINDDEYFDKIYNKGLKSHVCTVETGYNIQDFPNHRPPEWTLKNLMDINFLCHEMKRYIDECDNLDIHKKTKLNDCINNRVIKHE